MNTKDLTNEEYAEYMRRKRGIPEDVPLDHRTEKQLYGFVEQWQGHGISLYVREKKGSGRLLADVFNPRWIVEIAIPIDHPWFGLPDHEIGNLIQLHILEAKARRNNWIFSAVFTGTKEKAIAHGKRCVIDVIEAIPYPKDEGIATKAG